MWSNSVQENFAYQDYLDDSEGTAVGMAHLIVEEQWLCDHTRWDELLGLAFQLQKNERFLKRRHTRGGGTETKKEQRIRHGHTIDMRGDDDESQFDDDEQTMRRLYERWRYEATFEEEIPDDCIDEDPDYEEDNIEPRVGEDFATKLTWLVPRQITRRSDQRLGE